MGPAKSHSKNKTSVSGSSIPVLGVNLKRGQYVFWLLFNIDLGSATSKESSRRALLNDVAEHKSTLKNNRNTHYPGFNFTPKTGVELSEMAVLFLLCMTSFSGGPFKEASKNTVNF